MIIHILLPLSEKLRHLSSVVGSTRPKLIKRRRGQSIAKKANPQVEIVPQKSTQIRVEVVISKATEHYFK